MGWQVASARCGDMVFGLLQWSCVGTVVAFSSASGADVGDLESWALCGMGALLGPQLMQSGVHLVWMTMSPRM